MERPSTALLESAYDELFHSTLDNLIDSASYGQLFQGRQDHEEGVAGRSMAWKLFLSPRPPLTFSLNPYPATPLDSLRSSRERYVSLLKEKMRAPDGSYEEGFYLPGRSTPTSAAPRKPDNWNLNNPLSLDSSNPWHAYFSALESRNTIRQDVERTFPESAYFRSPIIQNEMTQILFIHANERESVGYRQGMHELLACIYYAVDFDSIALQPPSAMPQLQELCDRTYVAADSYTLFSAMMQRMEPWYEWRAPIPEQISPTSPYSIPHFSANGEVVHSSSQPLVNVLANGQLDLQPYVAPIVSTCTLLRDEKLRVVDPNLWVKMREGGVEPQMYGIRWLRLLFTREFPLAESMVIWDGLFASVAGNNISSSSSSHQGIFELALWISVAMLIRIRNTLIPGDYTTQLTQLLRYPIPSSFGSSHTSNAPALLLQQAQLLMNSPTPGTGASLVMQNRNELGIPIEVPSPQSSPVRAQRPNAPVTAPPTLAQGRATHAQDRPRLQDMIANRLLDANESLGIQKSFFNTISELRKNLPDLSQTLIRTPSWNGPTISLADEHADGTTVKGPPGNSFPTPDVDERPPWEPKPRSEVEREMNELQQLLKKLGDAVGWAVDVLLLHEDETEKLNDNEKSLRERKAEAVECMSYVRDVLARGGKGEVDEERLVSEEEYRRRKQKEKDRIAAATASVDTSPPRKPLLPPPRIAAPDNSTSSIKLQHSRDSSTPTSPLARTPFSYPHINQTSGTPLTSFSTRANQASRHKPLLATTTTQHQKVIPPWQHTPSNFSGDSPYISGLLPRYPPRSTTVLPQKPSDSSVSRSSPSKATESPEPPQTDPLGVLT